VYCDFFGIHILFLNFLRHQTMDKVQKYNSFRLYCLTQDTNKCM